MSTPAPASEPSSVRTAYAFLRPLPTVREEDASPAEVRPHASRDRWDRLFPSTAGIPDAGSSLDVAGLQLGQYLIQERIGRGGMGAVFRASDLRLERVVALKILAPEYTRDPASVQRFQNEARAAAKLDHENIARVFASGEDGGQQYIAFEFVTGTNIRDMIQQRRMLTPGETVNYLLQMADALRHTSAAGVVHRDIKPSNIIITPAGRAKLVDLGLARHQTQTDLTVHGTTLGTFDYISPEQALDPRNVDVRSDIYSLGCTAYHMLTGEPPYNRGSMFQKVLDHHQNDIPDASAKNPMVPQQMSYIIRRMMAGTVEARYQRPDDLIRDLLPLASALGVAASGGLWSELAPPRFAWAEHRGWILALGVLAVLGVVASLPPSEADSLPSTQVTPMGVAKPEAPAAKPIVAAEDGATTPAEQLVATGFQESTGLGITDLKLPDRLGVFPKAITSTSPQDTLIGKTANASNSRPSNATPTATPLAATDENKFFADSVGGVVKGYSSLEAACLEAPDNATIELRFDGISVQKPVRIEGKSLRIRAQMGRRPVLVFEVPEAIEQVVPSSMITVINGAVELFDTDIVFHVPRGKLVERWTIFALEQAKRLNLRGVSVTLENSSRQQPASILEVRVPSRTLMDRMMPDGSMRGPTMISMSESVFRGEADGLRFSEVLESSVDLTHTAWALSGNLVMIDTLNSVQMATSVEPPPCRLRMDHVTAMVDGSLISVVAGEAGIAPTVDVRCDNSLLSVLRADHLSAEADDRPMIKMNGPIEMDEWIDRLVWKGTSNYIAALGPWWEISATRSINSPKRRFNGSDWSQHWGSTGSTSSDRNAFEFPEAWDKPVFHLVDLMAFRLQPTSDFYRAPEASDGTHAGVDWRFPQVPKKLPQP